MPLLPIDLQTLFAQMDRVGKEQAIQKEISPQHQSLQGTEIVKKSEEKDKTVNETKEVGEGVEKVKEEEKKEKREMKKKEGKDRKTGKNRGAEEEIFSDPDLGKHIDLIG